MPRALTYDLIHTAQPPVPTWDRFRGKRIAVILPCYDEEAAIGRVVETFRDAVPGACVYVYDNNSKDRTVERAAAAGAIVRRERHQGKGNVVRHMFADVEADVYVMADGDGTYDHTAAPAMVERLIAENLDMIVATRLASSGGDLFPSGHRFGNRLLTWFTGLLFGRVFTDTLSGYRAFSRRFVKSFPALSSGFEIETELTIHALELKMPVDEIETAYFARPQGSASKLKTYRDGFRILMTIIYLVKELRPTWFYGLIAASLVLLSLVLAYPVVVTFMATGLVPRLPTAVLSTGLMILGVLSLACGLILDSVSGGRLETKRLSYLSIPAVGAASE